MWAESPEIREEFNNDFEIFKSYFTNREKGAIKLHAPALGLHESAPQSKTTVTAAEIFDDKQQKIIFDHSPELQKEFGNFNIYLSYMHGVAAGQIKEAQ